MDDIIKVIVSLVKSGLLIDDASQTVKHEINKKQGNFSAKMALMAVSLIAPVISSLINSITGKGRAWVALL